MSHGPLPSDVYYYPVTVLPPVRKFEGELSILRRQPGVSYEFCNQDKTEWHKTFLPTQTLEEARRWATRGKNDGMVRNVRALTRLIRRRQKTRGRSS